MNFRRTFTLSLASLGLAVLLPTQAQTARLQVVHNCADLAASQVDVYVNSTLLLDNFAFRTATPYIDVPAGVALNVGIAPGNSMGAGDAIFNQSFTLADGETYLMVASGTVSATGYTAATPFTLEVFPGARETAQGPGTDVLVLHGATDAPTVDVFESAVVSMTIVDDASYGDFAGYLELPTLDFTVQVRTADNSTIVAAYAAPLQTLGLQGAALTVLASGFLDPTNNSNGPGFGLWVALPSGGPLVELPSAIIPTARIQAIHNSADLAAAQVDVYLNGALLVDDFAFRSATPFVDVQAGVDLTLSIAPANSTSVNDAIAEFSYNLPADGSFILVANGIVSPSGYTPATPFDILVFADAREAATDPMNTDVLVLHGATDAPTVDVFESAVVNTTIVDDASYGDFAGYLELPTLDFTLQVRTADNSAIVAAYAAPLQTLGLEGAALTVLASGFLDPTNNSNGPGFGLWVALPSGGPLVELPSASIPTARIQAIHNSADLAAAQVDVYLNGALLVDDFTFRSATPFVDVQAGVDLTLSIAPANSTSVNDAIADFSYNLPADGSFILVANGIVSPSGYTPATPFDILVFSGAREAATDPMNTDILVLHGATDAPTVDVAETAVLAGATLVDDLSYGEFAGYLEVPTANYVLQVQDANGNGIISYQAPLASLSLDGAAITVLASGFLDPSVNSNGAGFGLWVALPSGGALVELPLATGLSENASPITGSNLWPNPSNGPLDLSVDVDKEARIDLVISDNSGRQVQTLGNVVLVPGNNRVALDLGELQNGTYYLTMVGKEFLRTMPLQLVR